MKDILFKAKRKDNGEWVEGYYLKYIKPANCCIEHRIFVSDLDGVTWYVVDEITICQYTGLTTKNGNKIWENDIIKYHFGNDVAPIRYGEYQSCFDNTKTGHIGFYVDWNGKQALRKDLGYWVNMIDCNVIGNTIDNPELIGA